MVDLCLHGIAGCIVRGTNGRRKRDRQHRDGGEVATVL